MKGKIRKYMLPLGILLLALGGAFWMGLQQGIKLGRGHFGWMHAAENHMYYMMWNLPNQKDRLAYHFEENMWLSIIDLHEFTKNPFAKKEEREAASSVLRRVIFHFHKNPRDIKILEEWSLSEEVDEMLGKSLRTGELNEREQETLRELAKGSSGALSEFEQVFGGLLDDYHQRDLRTHVLVDRLIKDRYFPINGWTGSGIYLTDFDITIKIPRGSYSISEGEFDFTGESLKVLYDGADLMVNGESYGELTEGDLVNLRQPGYVYVNDSERQPRGRQAQPHEGGNGEHHGAEEHLR